MKRALKNLERNFTANAEALAEFSLQNVILLTGQVQNCQTLRDTPKGIECRLWTGGKAFTGYVKRVDYQIAYSELVAGLLATQVGAPSAPCIALHDPREDHRRHPYLLFSAKALDNPVIDKKLHLFSGNPAIQGAAGQFLSWINDNDTHVKNHVYGADGSLCLFDQETLLMNKAVGIGVMEWMLKNRPLLPGQRRRTYDAGAQAMAERIIALPTAVISETLQDVQEQMPDKLPKGWQEELFTSLQLRQTALKQGPLRPQIGLIARHRLEAMRDKIAEKLG